MSATRYGVMMLRHARTEQARKDFGPKLNYRPLQPSVEEVFDAVHVMAGERCIGHLVSTGRLVIEAFSAADGTLGLFPDRPAAAAAITKVALSDLEESHD